MPAFLLHSTASDLLARRKSLPACFGDAFEREPGARRLGAVFVDLPYFSSFPIQVARHFLGRVSLSDPWGHIFHTRGVGSLAMAMIESIRRAHVDLARQPQPLAFLGGYLSHHAMDRLIHPIVQRHVREGLGDRGGHHETHHTEAEKYQSLFFHEELLRQDIMGSRYPLDVTSSFPGSSAWAPALPDTIVSTIQSAVIQVHACAPSRRLLTSWVRWTSWYGRLLSGPQGWREGIAALPSADTLKRRYFVDTDLSDWVGRAIDLTQDYLNAAADLLRAETVDRAARGRFLDAVPDIDLDVGA